MSHPEGESTRPWMGLALSFAAILVATVTYVVVLAPRMPPPAPPLCEATRTFLAGMNQKMYVDVYANVVDGRTARAVRRLDGLMARYRDAAHGKLAYALFQGQDDATRARASTEHLEPHDYELESGEKKPILMGIAFTYAGEHDDIAYVSPSSIDEIELWVTKKLRELVRRVDGPRLRIGVLGGHGEPKLEATDLVPGGAYSMTTILAQNFPYLELVPVDLAGGARPVDATLDGLLVTQPSSDVPDEELARIDDFVMKGKSLVVFAGAVNVKEGDPSMKATLSTHGLEKLTGGYGIDLARDVVLDFADDYESPELPNLPARAFPWVPLVADSKDPADSFLDPSFLPFAPLAGILVPFASSVSVHPERQPAAEVRVVARTSARASHVTTDVVSLDPERDLSPLAGHDRFDLAAVAEGSLRSAFSARTSDAPARVFVLASAAFLANPFARAGEGEVEQQIGTAYAKTVVTPLVLATKSTLEWMGEGEGERGCDARLLARAVAARGP